MFFTLFCTFIILDLIAFGYARLFLNAPRPATPWWLLPGSGFYILIKYYYENS